MNKIYIGTSGWSYEHWKDNFYPSNLKTNLWLNHYAKQFSTVEINSTFYRTPVNATVNNWFEQVPKNFIFSIKASRYITHIKRLYDCQESLEYFFNVSKGLKSKAGPILFQLPPSFKLNQERFTEFVSSLSSEYQYVFEFRHPSWYVDDIYRLLKKKKIALCITDLKGNLTPEEITADFTYIRLHGPHKAYQGSYSLTALKSWQKKIEKWQVDTYCYFDNDEKGYAVQDAMTLQNLL